MPGQHITKTGRTVSKTGFSTVTFWLDEKLRTELRVEAAHMDMSFSAFARQILRVGVAAAKKKREAS